MKYIVELQSAVWIDTGYRTTHKRRASRYKTEAAAKAALTRARRFLPFPAAKIEAEEEG